MVVCAPVKLCNRSHMACMYMQQYKRVAGMHNISPARPLTSTESIVTIKQRDVNLIDFLSLHMQRTRVKIYCVLISFF